MPSSEDNAVTYEAYCENCEEDRSVMRTVPWQDDSCMECGAAIDGGE